MRKAKANGFETDKYIDCMDISYDNRTLAFGGQKTIKLYSFDTAASYWFDHKTNFYPRKQFRNQMIRLVKWNKSQANHNLLAILFVESRGFYITNVKEDREYYLYNMDGNFGFMKEFLWVPDSKGDFFTGSTNNMIYLWNLTETVERRKRRQERRQQDDLEDDSVRIPIREISNGDVGITRIRFCPCNSYLLAVFGVNTNDTSYLTIYDLSKKNVVNSKRSQGREKGLGSEDYMLVDWEPKGQRLITSCNTYLDIWNFRRPLKYETISDYSLEYTEVDKKLNILNLKWMKDRKRSDGTLITGQILFSSIDQSFIKTYSLKSLCTSGQIVLNSPSYQKNISRWILDNNEDFMFVFMSKIIKHQVAKNQKLKLDKKGAHKEDSKNVFYAISLEFDLNTRRISRPLAMHLFNDLAFSARNSAQKNCLTIFQQREATSIHLVNMTQTMQQTKKKQKKKQQNKEKMLFREQIKKKKKEKKYLYQLYRSKSQTSRKEDEQMTKNLRTEQKIGQHLKTIKKNYSFQNIGKRSQLIVENVNFNRRSFSKIDRIVNEEEEDTESSSSQYESLDEEEWVMNYKEELLFLQKNYKIDLPDDKEEKREEAWKQNCKNNCRVALQIGKTVCAEFWTYLYALTFPEKEQSMTIQTIFEEQNDVEKYFENNMIMVYAEEPLDKKGEDKKSLKRPSLPKSIIQLNIEKQIQNLIDDNELQTAVIAAVFIRNKDKRIISEDYMTQILIHYKKNLKDHGMIHWASKIAMKAKLTESHDITLKYTRSGQVGPAPNYQAKIECGACHSYRNSSTNKCDCEMTCVFCSQPLKNSMIVICKVCGHAGHIQEYKHYFKQLGNTKCPMKNCMHHCFVADREKLVKWSKKN